jgi:hypothetical protein
MIAEPAASSASGVSIDVRSKQTPLSRLSGLAFLDD